MYINAFLASLLCYDRLTYNIYIIFLCTFGLVQFPCVILFSNLGNKIFLICAMVLIFMNPEEIVTTVTFVLFQDAL